MYVKGLAFIMANIVHPYVNSLNYLSEIYNIQRPILGISIAILKGGKSKLIHLFDLPRKTDFLVSFLYPLLT